MAKTTSWTINLPWNDAHCDNSVKKTTFVTVCSAESYIPVCTAIFLLQKGYEISGIIDFALTYTRKYLLLDMTEF